MKRHLVILCTTMLTSACIGIEPGNRALSLAAALPDSELKTQLQNCAAGPFRRTRFAISHRGAPLGYPEHTSEGYQAAARMGAGIIECDVTFTADGELVCRHSQCDLHRTTNILQTPLASQCTNGFTPATADTAASARCCTSDITLHDFMTLCGRRDVVDPEATSVDEYLINPPTAVNQAPSACGTLITHRQSIALIDALGADFTPELKAPEVDMPFKGTLAQDTLRRRLIDDYLAAGIDPARVYPQSFNPDDVQFWLEHYPQFANQAILLDGRGRDPGFRPTLAEMQRLADSGVRILAPPMPMLLTIDKAGELQASAYAILARQAGLQLITWTFESGRATDPDNWLYANLHSYMNSESKMLEVLHALRTKAGVRGVFSDWPGTVSYYANCMNIAP